MVRDGQSTWAEDGSAGSSLGLIMALRAMVNAVMSRVWVKTSSGAWRHDSCSSWVSVSGWRRFAGLVLSVITSFISVTNGSWLMVDPPL